MAFPQHRNLGLKFSREERLSALSQQEQLIQQKKREVEQKLAVKKTEPVESTASNSYRFDPVSRTNISTVAKEKIATIKKELDADAKVNAFKNDGSFMEQFKKFQSTSDPTSTTQKQGIVMKLQAPSQKILEPSAALEKLAEPDDDHDRLGISPPQDRAVQNAVEAVAISVAVNGSDAEATARISNTMNPTYNFLNETSGTTYQYFQQRVHDLKEAKKRAESEGTFEFLDSEEGLDSSSERKRKRKSRWGPEPENIAQNVALRNPALVNYAIQVFGTTALSDEQWKQLDDQRKMKALFEMMQAKKRELQALEQAGKVKYEYDSDEETDGGTWEHKRRMEEMANTKIWADELTEHAKGKHHIGDFLPPDELERFIEKWDAVKEGRMPDLSDYKNHKLTSDNVGYQMLQKLGWTEGQGLGADGSGITAPISKGVQPVENAGLGQGRPDEVKTGDDEYEAYRKRMMLAYRFRPNPLNNPRRPYY